MTWLYMYNRRVRLDKLDSCSGGLGKAFPQIGLYSVIQCACTVFHFYNRVMPLPCAGVIGVGGGPFGLLLPRSRDFAQ